MLPELITEVPGPESRRLAVELRRYESHNVTYVSEHWPVFWQRAEGANVWDVDGNRYVDFTGAFAVAGLGHGRREIVDAMSTQAGILLHGMGDVHPTRLKVDLCRELSKLTFERWGAGNGKTVLSNSGFEAVETALKTALLASGRNGILAFEGGYHGLGYGALMGTGIEKFREPFRSQLPDATRWLPFPRSEGEMGDLERALASVPTGRVGAVLVEPIQGRGGVVVPPEGFLRRLRQWCHEQGALLICDEIYTGFHRTGRLFACEWVEVVPDLICLGKSLSGGFPISACVGKAEIMDRWPESSGEALHTSTFLGHPVGCAMALEALRLHQEPGTAAVVARNSRQLEQMLRALEGPGIREVRGRGMMWGVEFEDPDLPGRIVGELLGRGLILLPAGSRGEVLSFSPPFVVSSEQIKACAGIMQTVVQSSRSAAPEIVPVSGAPEPSAPQSVSTDQTNPPEPSASQFVPYDETQAVEVSRRRLPHWRQDHATYFVTFRLKDSIPKAALQRWRRRRDVFLKSKGITEFDNPTAAITQLTKDDRREYHRTFGEDYQDILDAGHGACVLRDPANAAIVSDTLEHFAGERYWLGRYVIMPNHVHVLVRPFEGWDLSKIVQNAKSFSARGVNQRIGKTGSLWQAEPFDHIVRGLSEMKSFERYVEENPVKAKLREGEFRLGGRWVE